MNTTETKLDILYEGTIEGSLVRLIGTPVGTTINYSLEAMVMNTWTEVAYVNEALIPFLQFFIKQVK